MESEMPTFEMELLFAMNGVCFHLGTIVETPGAVAAMEQENITARELLRRHQGGDWGNVDPEDEALNHEALVNDLRIFSVYELPKTNETIWIITEADRSITTILLPAEY